MKSGSRQYMIDTLIMCWDEMNPDDKLEKALKQHDQYNQDNQEKEKKDKVKNKDKNKKEKNQIDIEKKIFTFLSQNGDILTNIGLYRTVELDQFYDKLVANGDIDISSKELQAVLDRKGIVFRQSEENNGWVKARQRKQQKQKNKRKKNASKMVKVSQPK